MWLFSIPWKLVKWCFSKWIDRICEDSITARLVLVVLGAAGFIAGMRYGVATLGLWGLGVIVGRVTSDLEEDDYPLTALSIRHAMRSLGWLPPLFALAAMLNAPWLALIFCQGLLATMVLLMLVTLFEALENRYLPRYAGMNR